MLRRYVDCAVREPHLARLGKVAVAGALRYCAAVAVPLLLAGCGSTQTLPPLEQYPQRTTAPAEQTPGAAPGTATVPATTAGESSVAPANQPAAPAATESTKKPSRFARQPRPESPKEQEAPRAEALEPLALDTAVIPPVAQQQFDAAIALAQSGDAVAAERAFDTLNAQYPNYAGPLVNLAILRAKAGNLEGAEKALQAAVERNPSSATAFNQLGIINRRLGRFKEADTAYQRAVQIDPSYANAHLNLGVLCDLYLQQPQRALEAYERYLELASPPDAKVSGWVTELKARLASSRSARSEQ